MESPHAGNNSLTQSQRQAVTARGNVLVMAGAGTGKTHTLVARCLDCLDKRTRRRSMKCSSSPSPRPPPPKCASASAACWRKNRGENPDDSFFAEQLALFDAAHIGTLHGFCFKLVREHFHELGLDPQPAMLDEGEARLLADETLDETIAGAIRGRGRIRRVGPKPDSNLRRRARRKNPLADFAPAPLRADAARCRRLARGTDRNIFRRRTGRMAKLAARPRSKTGATNGCRFWKI